MKASIEWPPNDFLQQFYGNSGRKWSSIAAAASLPICWDESLAERETADKEELVRLLSAPHRLETKSGLRRQSTCIKGIKVHVHLFVGTQDMALLCNIMGVMQGLEANQLHWIAMS